MFIINQTLNSAKIPEGQGEELFRQHVAWFTRHFECGDFLLVGPYTDKEMAGFMIAAVESREAVEDILKEDAYYEGSLANYEVRSFAAGKIAKNFADFVGR